MNIIEAPWTDEQVAHLNHYQGSTNHHPFTGVRGPGGKETILIATSAGWIERDGGPIVQTWAHSFMADGSFK